MPLLSLHGLRKTFGTVHAVDDVSFRVSAGTITGLLGRNGAGKTTTIRMITGIFLPDSGSIEWQPSSRSAENRIGYLPEERGLYRQMKVVEELLFLAEIKGRTGPDVRRDVDRWLERFDLGEKRNAKVEELSKGNQQKVQLIGTLLHDPELIVLDEPQSGLDPVNMVLVRDLLRELKKEGRTILLSTHMMGEAERLADDIVLIHKGKVVLDGSLASIRSSFGNNLLSLKYEGDPSFLRSLPQVKEVRLADGSAELRLSDGADAQQFLEAVIGRLRIQRFEVGTPSLEEIFIEKVGSEAAMLSGR